MSQPPDFVTICKPGLSLRTRDRGEATITRIDEARGLIHGELRMFGPCVWRRDGVYRDAPFGAPGPLDLMPPTDEAAPAHKRASVAGAITAGNRALCCD